MSLTKLLVLGAVLSAPLSLLSESGILAGQVKDPSGAVLDHVQIGIEHMERIASDRQQRYQLKADDIISSDYDGRFRVSLPSGDYVVLFVWQAFEPAVKRVRIEAGKTSNLKVQLKTSRLDKFID